MLNPMELALIKKLGGGNGGGGGGADLLNADGIIKQEVLPEGYPYAGSGYLLPETSVEIDPERGQGMLPDVVNATIGNTYTVNWNGAEYECVCSGLESDGMVVPVVGNLGAMTGEEGTGEPFLIMLCTAEIAAILGAGIAVVALDGSASVTLSIFGESITKMDAKFLPDDFVVTFTKADETAVGNSYEVNGNFTYEQITSAIEAGKQVKAVYLDDTQGLPMKIYFSLAANMLGNGVMFSTLYALDAISVMTITVTASGSTLSAITVTGA